MVVLYRIPIDFRFYIKPWDVNPLSWEEESQGAPQA